jgi:hypothetical protein
MWNVGRFASSAAPIDWQDGSLTLGSATDGEVLQAIAVAVAAVGQQVGSFKIPSPGDGVDPAPAK